MNGCSRNRNGAPACEDLVVRDNFGNVSCKGLHLPGQRQVATESGNDVVTMRIHGLAGGLDVDCGRDELEDAPNLLDVAVGNRAGLFVGSRGAFLLASNVEAGSCTVITVHGQAVLELYNEWMGNTHNVKDLTCYMLHTSYILHDKILSMH